MQSDYKNAFEWGIRAANAGNVLAAYLTGCLLCEGLGCKKDIEAGILYLRQAIAGGVQQAAIAIGLYWIDQTTTLTDEEYEKKLADFVSAVYANDSACYQLYSMLKGGTDKQLARLGNVLVTASNAYRQRERYQLFQYSYTKSGVPLIPVYAKRGTWKTFLRFDINAFESEKILIGLASDLDPDTILCQAHRLKKAGSAVYRSPAFGWLEEEKVAKLFEIDRSIGLSVEAMKKVAADFDLKEEEYCGKNVAFLIENGEKEYSVEIIAVVEDRVDILFRYTIGGSDEVASACEPVLVKKEIMKESERECFFEDRAKRCAMGDLQSMLWMFRKFREKLTEGYLALEAEYSRDASVENLNRLEDYLRKHAYENDNFRVANMWLYRAAMYGSEEAKSILLKYPFCQRYVEFGMSFQIPGRRKCCYLSGIWMHQIGFLDFETDVSYDTESLNERGVYVASRYASCEGPDETGFGMEEEYDYYFFDEFFCFLFNLHAWSKIDFRANEKWIWAKCEEEKEKKCKERDIFWMQNRERTDMERCRSFGCSLHGPVIVDGELIIYLENRTLSDGCYEHVIIPDGVTKIKSRAFEMCNTIEEVEIPETVTELGEEVFYLCENLKRVSWMSGGTRIPRYTFFHCRSLEEVLLPEDVTEIGEGAFVGCRSLKHIKFPDALVEIRKSAFLYCESLEQIVLPKKLKSIGAEAFAYCKVLREIVMPENVTVSASAFANCGKKN